MKRTIEIDDTLQETVDQCVEEFMDLWTEFHKENPDGDYDAFWDAISYDGRDHEIIDSNTPIYNSEIDGLYYLYGDDFDEAYANAGIGDGSEDNHRQVCIYCYLEQEVHPIVREKVEETV